MDKTLESFLHPHRKPNVKFKLSSFDGEFEMRPLTPEEGVRCMKFSDQRSLSGSYALLPYVAEALVTPNLRDKELQDALSEQTGKKIMEPYDAATAMFTDSEFANLVEIYMNLVVTPVEYSKGIEQAKN